MTKLKNTTREQGATRYDFEDGSWLLVIDPRTPEQVEADCNAWENYFERVRSMKPSDRPHPYKNILPTLVSCDENGHTVDMVQDFDPQPTPRPFPRHRPVKPIFWEG